jgi:hypothetical protein
VFDSTLVQQWKTAVLASCSSWLRDKWQSLPEFNFGERPLSLYGKTNMEAIYKENSQYLYYGEMPKGTSTDRSLDGNLMMGKGLLFYKNGNKIVEGWFNTVGELIYGRYTSDQIKTTYTGYMKNEYFEGVGYHYHFSKE